ncbi:12666_t:CDS:2, partial [Funneliformis caledonium]
YDCGLSLSIIRGARKEKIDGIPFDYGMLYQKKYPNMNEVVLLHKKLVSLEKYNEVTEKSVEDYNKE